MEKLREVPHSKTIFKLSLEKTTKQLIQTVIEKLENTLNGIQISDYKIDNLSNLEKPIIESFTFSTGNYCEIIGNKMFVNPKLFLQVEIHLLMEIEKCLFIWISQTGKISDYY
jgi:hypothetical protein